MKAAVITLVCVVCLLVGFVAGGIAGARFSNDHNAAYIRESAALFASLQAKAMARVRSGDVAGGMAELESQLDNQLVRTGYGTGEPAGLAPSAKENLRPASLYRQRYPWTPSHPDKAIIAKALAIGQ